MTESSTITQPDAGEPDHVALFRGFDDDTLRRVHKLMALEIQRRAATPRTPSRRSPRAASAVEAEIQSPEDTRQVARR